MYNYEDEEQKRLASLGAPLSGIQYRPAEAAPAPLQERPRQPGVAEQLGTQYVAGKVVGNNGLLDKGFSYAGDKIGGAIDTMKAPAPLSGEAPMGEVAQTGLMEPTAADVAAFNTPPAAPLGAAPANDAALNVANEALLENSATAGMVDVGAPLAAGAGDVATAGATDAAAGLSASTAGPLAGVVEFAKTGDVKKGVGAGAGAAAGAIAGNALLPGVGGYLGSMVGSQLGSAVGGK